MTGMRPLSPEPAPPPDAAQSANWVRAIATHGDRDAFARLFAYFAPRIKAYMFRFSGNAETAEELAQEAMMQVWRKAHLFDPAKAAASTWIFTIARNLRIDRFRQNRHIELDDTDPALIIDDDPIADEIVAREQHAFLVQNAIGDLPPDQRQVVELSFFEDLSHSQIADRLEIPLGTVKSRLRLALDKLRGGLEGVA